MFTLRHVLVFTALVAALRTGAAAATIPSGEPVDGVRCDTAEGRVMHIHPHLTILDHGRPVAIPSDVGQPLGANCLYWLHTHTADGILHVESPLFRTFTLGEFFAVWGRPLSRTDVAGAKPRKGETVRVFVQGRPYGGDPRRIELAQHLDIDILVGPPYAVPRPFVEWNGL